MTSEAGQISIDLEISNPNLEPLELRTFRYEVSVDGQPVYAGKRSAQATLGGGSSKAFTLPAVMPGHVPAAASWSVRGRLLYVTPGALAEILLDSGVRKPRAGFAGSGTLAPVAP